jgi:hypothetical protein
VTRRQRARASHVSRVAEEWQLFLGVKRRVRVDRTSRTGGTEGQEGLSRHSPLPELPRTRVSFSLGVCACACPVGDACRRDATGGWSRSSAAERRGDVPSLGRARAARRAWRPFSQVGRLRQAGDGSRRLGSTIVSRPSTLTHFSQRKASTSASGWAWPGFLHRTILL